MMRFCQYWPVLSANTSQYWAYTGKSFLVNQYFNRTGLGRTFTTGTILRPYFWLYGCGTGNHYGCLYWHKTGMMTLHQYWIVLSANTSQYWAYMGKTFLVNQYLNRTGLGRAITTATILHPYWWIWAQYW